MARPRIYADFHNADALGRLRLNCVGTLEDLAAQGIELRAGLMLTLYADDLDDRGELDELTTEGAVAFSEEEHCWVAAIDWAGIRHVSVASDALANGHPEGLLPESRQADAV